MKIDLTVTRDGNNIIGNFWRVSAWRGSAYLGEKIYAGYTKRDAVSLARGYIAGNGSLFSN
jgi:hypothetical protein